MKTGMIICMEKFVMRRYLPVWAEWNGIFRTTSTLRGAACFCAAYHFSTGQKKVYRILSANQAKKHKIRTHLVPGSLKPTLKENTPDKQGMFLGKISDSRQFGNNSLYATPAMRPVWNKGWLPLGVQVETKIIRRDALYNQKSSFIG